MTPEEIAAIRARWAAATKGEWYVARDTRQDRGGKKYGVEVAARIPEADRRPWQSAGWVGIADLFSPRNPYSVNDPVDEPRAEREANAQFIAHAHEDVPALLNEVARLMAERDRWIREYASKDDDTADEETA